MTDVQETTSNLMREAIVLDSRKCLSDRLALRQPLLSLLSLGDLESPEQSARVTEIRSLLDAIDSTLIDEESGQRQNSSHLIHACVEETNGIVSLKLENSQDLLPRRRDVRVGKQTTDVPRFGMRALPHHLPRSLNVLAIEKRLSRLVVVENLSLLLPRKLRPVHFADIVLSIIQSKF